MSTSLKKTIKNYELRTKLGYCLRLNIISNDPLEVIFQTNSNTILQRLVTLNAFKYWSKSNYSISIGLYTIILFFTTNKKNLPRKWTEKSSKIRKPLKRFRRKKVNQQVYLWWNRKCTANSNNILLNSLRSWNAMRKNGIKSIYEHLMCAAWHESK